MKHRKLNGNEKHFLDPRVRHKKASGHKEVLPGTNREIKLIKLAATICFYKQIFNCDKLDSLRVQIAQRQKAFLFANFLRTKRKEKVLKKSQ